VKSRKAMNYNVVINSKYCSGFIVGSTDQCLRPTFSLSEIIKIVKYNNISVDFRNGLSFALLNVSLYKKFHEYFGVKSLNLPNYFIFDVYFIFILYFILGGNPKYIFLFKHRRI
jgi:hypothetical protein